MAKVKAPRAIGAKGKKPVANVAIEEKEIAKINCVEGEQAFENFMKLTRQLLSVPKREIVEMERKRKKKK